jgi:hypothetical protein
VIAGTFAIVRRYVQDRQTLGAIAHDVERLIDRPLPDDAGPA